MVRSSNIMRDWISFWRGASSASVPRRRPRTAALSVQGLEERVVLSAIGLHAHAHAHARAHAPAHAHVQGHNHAARHSTPAVVSTTTSAAGISAATTSTSPSTSPAATNSAAAVSSAISVDLGGSGGLGEQGIDAPSPGLGDLGGGGGGGGEVVHEGDNGFGGPLPGLGDLGGLSGLGGDCGRGGGGTSSTLGQDARLVRQAFQTFDASYLSAVAALQLTATSTTGPTAAGLTAFDSVIAAAITTLNTSISSDLSNLTNTGSALATTIDGFTASLQTELDSAATGLANSSNSAVLSLNQEANQFIRSAVSQTTSAILNDSPAGTISATTLQTYHQAVRTAYQAFSQTISNAVQASIAGGTALSTTAVAPLQTALDSALAGLGLPAANALALTTTVNADLATLTSQLSAIPAPTVGNTASAFVFVRAVASDVAQNLGPINLAVSTAIRNYDNSLL